MRNRKDQQIIVAKPDCCGGKFEITRRQPHVVFRTTINGLVHMDYVDCRFRDHAKYRGWTLDKAP
jgi:hypothetical protein